MKTATIISKLFLLAFLLMPNAILAQNKTINVNGTQIQVSSNLQAIFDQAEKVYINPIGYSIEDVYHKAPDMIPLFIGLIMQRQEIYLDQIKNIDHLKNYFALQNEILSFMGQFAQAHNYINPIGGSKLSPIQMHKDFKSGLNGDFNNLYINKFGINPTTVNITYLFDSSPNSNSIANNDYNNPTNTNNEFTAIQPENNNVNTIEPAYIELAEEDEAPTEINLFGEVSGAAENGHKPREKGKVPPEDAILGTWHDSSPGGSASSLCEENVTFQKKEGQYVGVQICKRKDYTITLIFTIVETTAYPEDDRLPSFLGSYRDYKVKVIYICNPKKNEWACNEKPKIESLTLSYNKEGNYYNLGIMGAGLLNGYRKYL